MFTYEGFTVKFKHEPDITGRVPNEFATPFHGRTMCLIMREGQVLAAGYGWCAWYENEFSRSVGRKVAFTRALGHFNKEQRTLLWQAYWDALPRKETQ